MSSLVKKWIMRGCKVAPEQINHMAGQLGISVMEARLLAVRGLVETEDVRSFLGDEPECLHPPELMQDMTNACRLIRQAIQTGQKIVVYGDYDVDGVTATSIMVLALRRLGGNVSYYIPSRAEGYGLNEAAVRRLAGEGTGLLLTVDNGIMAAPQVELAKSLGLTVVVTDHHEVPFDPDSAGHQQLIPPADAVVDPHRQDCAYPFKSICAGMIACKMAEYLYRLAGREEPQEALEYRALAAIATVCDIMELVDENRELLRSTLRRMPAVQNIGLRALLETNRLNPDKLTAHHIGFVIGPCINAGGRLETADIAVELLLSDDYEQALGLARHLTDLNAVRKDMSVGGTAAVREIIEKSGYADDRVIVVHMPELPESIAGIVAGRIKEIYNRPVFILAGGAEKVKGSGRSVDGYNMFEALVQCSDLLTVFGGHYMAAGLTLPAGNVAELRRRLNEACLLELEEMTPQVYVDMPYPVERAVVNNRFAQFIRSLEPFGHGNREPLFGDLGLAVRSIQLMGADRQFMRVYFANRSQRGVIAAVSFRHKEELYKIVLEKGGEKMWQDLLCGRPVQLELDIIYSIGIDDFRGQSNVQVSIVDLRLHQNVRQAVR